jgi:hypothetical protein
MAALAPGRIRAKAEDLATTGLGRKAEARSFAGHVPRTRRISMPEQLVCEIPVQHAEAAEETAEVAPQ